VVEDDRPRLELEAPARHGELHDTAAAGGVHRVDHDVGHLDAEVER
jgi:hypothetical protein